MPPYQVVPIIIHSQDPLKLTGVKQLECCCDPIHINALRCLTWYQLTSNSLSKTKRVMTINQCQSVTNSHMAPWEGASACLSWTPEPTESQHSVHHWRRERGSASLSGRLGHPKSRQVDYLSVPEVNKHWPHFNYWQRRTAEAILITQQSPTMNLDCPDLLYIYVAWIAQKTFSFTYDATMSLYNIIEFHDVAWAQRVFHYPFQTNCFEWHFGYSFFDSMAYLKSVNYYFATSSAYYLQNCQTLLPPKCLARCSIVRA